MTENQNIEWKESWRDEYLKWICGFANAQDGRIFIGKNDQGVVTGLKNCKKLEDIPNKVRDVLGLIIDVNQHTENGLNYLEIIASVKDLRNDSFDIFREQALLSKRLDKKTLDADNEQLLDSLNLLENGMLKRAGILLFHHNPEKWIPGAYIKIGFFASDSEITYQDELHGSLISQAERVVDMIYTKYLKGLIGYKGVVRTETYPFPKEAIREAVFNAIAHKFYGALISVQIRVYTDKIYIANDCVFPEDWTVADLLGKHRSRPYNPLIANTFFRAGFIEAWGRGIEKISESCTVTNTPLPEICIKSDEMTVIFSASTEYLKLKEVNGSVETEDSSVEIYKMMAQNPQITLKEIAEQLNVTKRAVEKRVKQLREKGRIIHIGPKKVGQWKVLQISKN